MKGIFRGGLLSLNPIKLGPMCFMLSAGHHATESYVRMGQSIIVYMQRARKTVGSFFSVFGE